jgi:DNA-binding transcriptional LysR family regulator
MLQWRIAEDNTVENDILVSWKRTMRPLSHALQTQQLADMVVFAKVVETASFTAAAQALGLNKSAVSKQVQRLEQSLSARLLHRTTRKLTLTEAGQALCEHAEQVARLAGAAQDAVSQLASRPAGLLRMTASAAYGAHVLAPLLGEFHRLYPDVRLALTLVDRHVHLTEEGMDLAIRLTDQPDPSLAGRPLHRCDWVVCASPAFLRKARVRLPADLGRQPCFAFAAAAPGPGPGVWHFEREAHAAVDVAVAGPVSVNSSDAVREMVLAGMGVGLVPRFVVQPELQRGELVPVLPRWRVRGSLGGTAWALWQAQRQVPPKLRVMVDFLAERLADETPAHPAPRR